VLALLFSPSGARAAGAQAWPLAACAPCLSPAAVQPSTVQGGRAEPGGARAVPALLARLLSSSAKDDVTAMSSPPVRTRGAPASARRRRAQATRSCASRAPPRSRCMTATASSAPRACWATPTSATPRTPRATSRPARPATGTRPTGAAAGAAGARATPRPAPDLCSG
jgi:hypothetical protein